MSHPSVSETLFERTIQDQACAFCGAQLRLTLMRAQQGNDVFDYYCPDCGKQYEAEAALVPQVRLLAHRTDGRSGPYQQTMF